MMRFMLILVAGAVSCAALPAAAALARSRSQVRDRRLRMTPTKGNNERKKLLVRFRVRLFRKSTNYLP